MNETWPQGVKRRWRNLVNAARGIDDYTDEHGIRHLAPDVDEHLNRKDDDA
jgi:hypothetical protein